MFLVGFFSWWYGAGLLERFQMIKAWLLASVDFFSVGLLASTLFAPYRQISAGRVQGSIADQMSAFTDRSISRIVGAFVRSFMIIIGIIAMLLEVLSGVLVMALWLILPALPVIGLIVAVTGWVPQWMN